MDSEMLRQWETVLRRPEGAVRMRKGVGRSLMWTVVEATWHWKLIPSAS